MPWGINANYSANLRFCWVACELETLRNRISKGGGEEALKIFTKDIVPDLRPNPERYSTDSSLESISSSPVAELVKATSLSPNLRMQWN
jgi:hypothetical protein